jgi:MFS transporter, AAHS family, 4-hydroxybenzoate transporter
MSNASIAETVIESHVRSRRGFLPLGLCAATMFVEGYDAQLMGYVVPGIARDWGISPLGLTPAIAFGLIGMALGAFFIAPLADIYGRRKLLLSSVIVFGVLTVATAYAQTLAVLIALRFVTGLGLGGAMPNAIAITAEFSPPKWRAWIVAMLFCFYSLGAGFGGLIAAWLIPISGWGSVLLFCGAMALLLWPVLVFGMPESYVPESEHKPKLPARRLFEAGRARMTIILWIIFFANLMELFFLTSWLPLTLTRQGLSSANSAYATSLVQFAGIGGAILMGPLVDIFGPRRVLPAAYLLTALSVAGIGLAGSEVAFTMVMAVGIGIGTVGTQNCNNGVAAKFYPMPIRATGVGWALAVGRIGSIVGPVVGGILLSTRLDIRTIFLVAAVPPLVAMGAYLAMGRSFELDADRPED